MLRHRRAAQAAAELEARQRESALAAQDARLLVRQMVGSEPLHSLDHYQFGVALGAGDRALRSGRSEWRYRLVAGPPEYWSDPHAVTCLLTTQQVAYRIEGGSRLHQIWWSNLAGLTLNLSHEQLLLDFRDGDANLFTGPTVHQLGVVAIAAVYGVHALLEHPALTALRTEQLGMSLPG